MKTNLFSILFAVALIFLTGCMAPTPLLRSQVSMIQKGANISVVESHVKGADLEENFEFNASGNDYIARSYALQTGMTQSTSMVCTPTCIPVVVNVPVTAPYVFVFNKSDQNLVAWGLIEELSKSPDSETREIMPTLKTALLAEQAKKKKSRKSKKSKKDN